MKVFTDEWKRRVTERYKRLPDHKKPDIYFVATGEQFEQLRLELERGVAALSPAAQNSVIAKLRSPKKNIVVNCKASRFTNRHLFNWIILDILL